VPMHELIAAHPARLSLAGDILESFPIGGTRDIPAAIFTLLGSPRGARLSRELYFLPDIGSFGFQHCDQKTFFETFLVYELLFSCSVTFLCDRMDCSTPGFPVFHHLPEFAQLLSIGSVMPSNHLLLCCHLLLPSIFPSIKADMLIICHLWIIYVHLIRSCDL